MAAADLLMRQVRAIGRKQEIELDRWRLHLLKVSAVELRRDQAWRHKVQTDICRNTTIMKKVRSDIQQYQSAFGCLRSSSPARC